MAAGCGRAMKPGGWRPRGSRGASMDGVDRLAARFLCGLPTAMPSCPPRVRTGNGQGGDPVRPEIRAASRRARGKRLRGAACLVETVKRSKHRARPGRPAPSLTAWPQAAKSHARNLLPPLHGEGRRSEAEPGWGTPVTPRPRPASHFPTLSSLRADIPPHFGGGRTVTKTETIRNPTFISVLRHPR